MPTADGGTLPTLSQIRDWQITHLEDAAEHWSSQAWAWENAFTDLHHQIASPGGRPWEGVGAEAAYARASADKVAVAAMVEKLHAATAIAREGASEIGWAKQAVLTTVEKARSQGFSVGADLSVMDRTRGALRASVRAARQFQSTELASEIRAAAQNLLTVDTRVGTRISTVIDGLRAPGDLGAAEPPHGDAVQAVDFKQGPPGPFPEAPWEYNNDYTTTVNARGPDGKVVDGGTLVSLDDVWDELHRCFNCNFPIGGAPKEFPKVGDQIPLEMNLAGVKAANLPVEVTQVSRTADAIDIEFATLPGHADGPGSTIHFRWTEQGGAPNLDIRGYITEGPGSGDNPFSAPARVGYTGLAQLVWQPYIDNVVTHVVQSKGYEALPLRVVGGH